MEVTGFYVHIKKGRMNSNLLNTLIGSIGIKTCRKLVPYREYFCANKKEKIIAVIGNIGNTNSEFVSTLQNADIFAEIFTEEEKLEQWKLENMFEFTENGLF